MDITVRTTPGAAGALEPVDFRIGPRQLHVLEILDRWLSAAHSYFKVRADDGALYILRHDLLQARWEMTLFQAP